MLNIVAKYLTILDSFRDVTPELRKSTADDYISHIFFKAGFLSFYLISNI